MFGAGCSGTLTVTAGGAILIVGAAAWAVASAWRASASGDKSTAGTGGATEVGADGAGGVVGSVGLPVTGSMLGSCVCNLVFSSAQVWAVVITPRRWSSANSVSSLILPAWLVCNTSCAEASANEAAAKSVNSVTVPGFGSLTHSAVKSKARFSASCKF